MATIYEFGPFRLETDADTLFHGAEPVALGGRAVALLRLLLEKAGKPVAKDALMEAAWPGLANEESNLTVQIAALRRTFAAVEGGSSWIETLPRRGYRYVGPPAATLPDDSRQTWLPSASSDKPSIAVLPFSNLSGDPAQTISPTGSRKTSLRNCRVSGRSSSWPASPASLTGPARPTSERSAASSGCDMWWKGAHAGSGNGCG